MTDGRRILGTFAVVALVLLRLAIGWHFFQQGTQKLAYNANDGSYRIDFSAEPFLAQAKGPLAPWYQAQLSNVHDWPALLAASRQITPPSDEEAKKQSKWFADDRRAKAEAAQNGESEPINFPPFAPYYEWAERIADDWAKQLAEFKSAVDLTDEQQAAADKILQQSKQQLAGYFSEQSAAIADYQHELWRLETWRARPEADGVPFQQERIATKAAEVNRTVSRWVNQVREFENQFHQDLFALLNDDQLAQSETFEAAEVSLSDPRDQRLAFVNTVVTILIITVGVCLLIGFFTRLASLAGALFLLAVIASQPPWVADAAPTIEQTVELAGLLVLTGTGAGRWFGLDYFTYVLFGRCRRNGTE